MQPIQDWTPVSWNKNNERKTAAEKKLELKQALRNGTAITTAKFMAGKNSNAPERLMSSRKIEEEEENFELKTISLDIRIRIQQARLAKKMTQKQLANAINEKPSLIQDYESGKAVPTPQVLNKIERVIGRVRPPKKHPKK